MRYVFMRYPMGRSKAVTFSYDDGVKQDQRLAALFTAHGLKATFNFNCEAAREFCYTSDEIREYFLSKGHEIAVHGEYHRALGSVRPIEGIRDVLHCRLELEEKCGGIIRGMAYPDTGITKMNGPSSYEQIRQYLKELDIAYARTLAGDNDSFRLPEDFYAWMPSAHHDNPKITEYIDKFLALDLSTAVYRASRAPRLMYIWGHSYEFDKKDNWAHIEEICRKLSHHEDIWYATNIEICEYVEAYNRLRYSANGKLAYNPTLHTLWLDVDGRVISIAPGETARLEE